MLLGYKIAPYNGKRDEGQVILIRKNKSKGMNYETQKRLHRRDVECGGVGNDHCASGNACEVFVEIKTENIGQCVECGSYDFFIRMHKEETTEQWFCDNCWWR